MSNDFLDHAEAAIIALLNQERPVLLQAFGKVKHTLKADHSVVTELDKQLEQKLRARLLKLDPRIGIEGEEFGTEGSRETYWLIDPIDGTELFIRGIPSCRNMMCLVDRGEVVWSLLYMFVTDELWVARKGGGTTRNGQAVQMTYRPLERAWLDVKSSLTDPVVFRMLQAVKEHMAGFAIMRDPTLIFGGNVDAQLAYKSGGGPWDFAPRGLLFAEAGGRIANLGKDTYDFTDSSFLMAHPRNFDTLMEIVMKVLQTK